MERIKISAGRRTSGALAWQAEREDAVAGANEHLHPSKIFKIKNPQLKIQNSLVSKDIIHNSTLTGGIAGVLVERIRCIYIRQKKLVIFFDSAKLSP